MKIKKKLVRVGKTVPSRTVNQAAVEAINLADDCRSATLNSFRIVQLDEMIVSKTTFPKFDWALKLQNTTTEWHQMNNQAIAVIAAISRERGVKLVMTFKKSVNIMKYKIFLENLRSVNLFDDILLIQDNLSVHKSLEA